MAKYTLKRFSSENEDQEEKPKKKKRKNILPKLAMITGAGMTIFGNMSSQDLAKNSSEESKKLYDKLKEQILKKGDRTILDDDDYKKEHKTFFDKLKLKKENKTINQNNNPDGVSQASFIRDSKTYKIDKDFKGSAFILAHEAGHDHHINNEKNTLGKILHSKVLAYPARYSGTLGVLAGLHSGFKKKKLEREGKKESKWNKYKSVIIPALGNAVTSGKELAASIKGYKTLKELGASDELLTDSALGMSSALQTYVGKGLMDMAKGVGSRAVGEWVADKYYKYKDKNKKNQEEED